MQGMVHSWKPDQVYPELIRKIPASLFQPKEKTDWFSTWTPALQFLELNESSWIVFVKISAFS